MAINCDPTCLILAPSFIDAGCDPKASVRSGFIKNFIFTRCDTLITDITDDTEIQGYVTGNLMVATPPLTGELASPTLSDEITENCNTPIALKRTYNLTATSVRTDPSGLTDFTAYNDLDQSIGQWFVSWVDCENNIFVPQSFATGGELGWQANGQITPAWDNTSSMKWNFDLSFNYKFIPKGVALTDAVAAVLGIG